MTVSGSASDFLFELEVAGQLLQLALAPLEGHRHGHLDPVHAERLQHVVIGPLPEAVDGGHQPRLGRHHDDGRLRSKRGQLLQQRLPVLVGHLDAQNDERKRPGLLRQTAGQLHAVRAHDLRVACVQKRTRHLLLRFHVVIDDQYPVHRIVSHDTLVPPAPLEHEPKERKSTAIVQIAAPLLKAEPANPPTSGQAPSFAPGPALW